MADKNGFLAAIHAQAEAHPGRECWRNTSGRALTYGELWDASDELACRLRERGWTEFVAAHPDEV